MRQISFCVYRHFQNGVRSFNITGKFEDEMSCIVLPETSSLQIYLAAQYKDSRCEASGNIQDRCFHSSGYEEVYLL
jgi:hypothetical protein